MDEFEEALCIPCQRRGMSSRRRGAPGRRTDTPPSSGRRPKRQSPLTRERARANEKGGMASRAPAAFPLGAAAWYTRGKSWRAGTRQPCKTLQRRGREGPPAPQGTTHCAARGWDVPAPKTTNLGRKKRKRRQRYKEAYMKAR